MLSALGPVNALLAAVVSFDILILRRRLDVNNGVYFLGVLGRKEVPSPDALMRHFFKAAELPKMLLIHAAQSRCLFDGQKFFLFHIESSLISKL